MAAKCVNATNFLHANLNHKKAKFIDYDIYFQHKLKPFLPLSNYYHFPTTRTNFDINSLLISFFTCLALFISITSSHKCSLNNSFRNIAIKIIIIKVNIIKAHINP